MRNDSIDFVRDEILQRIEALQAQVCRGAPENYQEYKFFVGQIRGLTIAYNLTLPQEERKEEAA